jgi:hypothetical protein
MGKIKQEKIRSLEKIGNPPKGFQLPGFGFLPVIDVKQGQGITGTFPAGDRGGYGGIQTSAQEDNGRRAFFHLFFFNRDSDDHFHPLLFPLPSPPRP